MPVTNFIDKIAEFSPTLHAALVAILKGMELKAKNVCGCFGDNMVQTVQNLEEAVAGAKASIKQGYCAYIELETVLNCLNGFRGVSRRDLFGSDTIEACAATLEIWLTAEVLASKAVEDLNALPTLEKFYEEVTRQVGGFQTLWQLQRHLQMFEAWQIQRGNFLQLSKLQLSTFPPINSTAGGAKALELYLQAQSKIELIGSSYGSDDIVLSTWGDTRQEKIAKITAELNGVTEHYLGAMKICDKPTVEIVYLWQVVRVCVSKLYDLLRSGDDEVIAETEIGSGRALWLRYADFMRVLKERYNPSQQITCSPQGRVDKLTKLLQIQLISLDHIIAWAKEKRQTTVDLTCKLSGSFTFDAAIQNASEVLQKSAEAITGKKINVEGAVTQLPDDVGAAGVAIEEVEVMTPDDVSTVPGSSAALFSPPPLVEEKRLQLEEIISKSVELRVREQKGERVEDEAFNGGKLRKYLRELVQQNRGASMVVIFHVAEMLGKNFATIVGSMQEEGGIVEKLRNLLTPETTVTPTLQ